MFTTIRLYSDFMNFSTNVLFSFLRPKTECHIAFSKICFGFRKKEKIKKENQNTLKASELTDS